MTVTCRHTQYFIAFSCLSSNHHTAGLHSISPAHWLMGSWAVPPWGCYYESRPEGSGICVQRFPFPWSTHAGVDFLGQMLTPFELCEQRPDVFQSSSMHLWPFCRVGAPVSLWPCQSWLVLLKLPNSGVMWHGCHLPFPVVTDVEHFFMSSMMTPLPHFLLLVISKCFFLKIPWHGVLCITGWPQNHHVLVIFLPLLHKCYACSCVWPHPACVCSLYSLYMCPLSQICLTNIAFIPWAILGFLDISRPKHCHVFRMYKGIYFYIGIYNFSFCSFECISFINVFEWLKGRIRRQGKGLNVQPLETQSLSNCTWLAVHKVNGPFTSQAEMQEEPGEPHTSTDRIRGGSGADIAFSCVPPGDFSGESQYNGHIGNPD